MTVAIGVDLGGTNLRAGLVDFRGTTPVLVNETRRPLTKDKSPAFVAHELADAVSTLNVDAPAPITAVGIGLAGMLRGESGVISNSPNLGWRDVPAGQLFSDAVGVPVVLGNDVDVIAWGEHLFGAGRNANEMICVFVGTGVGGGLVQCGKLYIGGNHMAGEIGHTKVSVGPQARACPCGQQGCLEAYAGGASIAARLAEDLQGGVKTALRDEAQKHRLHAGHLDAAAAEGDPYAQALLDEIAMMLAMGLANAVTFVNPERLVLGGTVWARGPELRRRTLALLPKLINGPSQEGFSVASAELGDHAGIFGSAALASRRQS